jgi:hypothetical protein
MCEGVVHACLGGCSCVYAGEGCGKQSLCVCVCVCVRVCVRACVRVSLQQKQTASTIGEQQQHYTTMAAAEAVVCLALEIR